MKQSILELKNAQLLNKVELKQIVGSVDRTVDYCCEYDENNACVYWVRVPYISPIPAQEYCYI